MFFNRHAVFGAAAAVTHRPLQAVPGNASTLVSLQPESFSISGISSKDSRSALFELAIIVS